MHKIIDFLKRKDEYVSGDYISHRLGISRQALWKQIQELKEIGYDIVAVPHLGYKLVSSPDRLFAQEISRQLQTKLIGKKIYYFDEIPSTMDIATQLGIAGTAEGTLVISEYQSKGRGRLGRNWVSPKYKGIYLSLILKPKILPNQTPILTLLTAISIFEAIKENTGIETQIKWPNDILIHNKKIAGVLTELNAEMDEIRFVVIGIGLNVNNDAKSLPTGATSLKLQKKEDISRVELSQEMLRRIEFNYHLFLQKGSLPIVEKWRELSSTLGKMVKVVSHRHSIDGQAIDIDVDGSLLVRKNSGVTEKVTAGDVVHCG